MKRAAAITKAINTAAKEHTLAKDMGIVLEYFAERVDNRIQNELIGQLIDRFVAVSRQLEEKNRELSRSDAGRREAQKIALLGNWEYDIHAKKMWWSDTSLEILEVDKSPGPDIDWYLEKVYPEDRETVRRIVDDFALGIAPREHRSRLLMEDGRVKWVHRRYVVERDGQGRPLLVHGTIQDITAVRLAEEELLRHNGRLEELVSQKVEEALASQLATIHALVKLAESRDDDTGAHIERVPQYCRLIAHSLLEGGHHTGIVNAAFVENLAKASPLHDIGKVGIPDAILLKPAKLTCGEMEIMKKHVSIGYETLASVHRRFPMNEFVKMGMDVALRHHEKWDGSGYPDGLCGQEIPLAARIMALADIYDSLRSVRVYKAGYSHQRCVQLIMEESGKSCDPLLVELFRKKHLLFQQIFDRLEAAP